MATQPIEMPSPASRRTLPEKNVVYMMVHIEDNSGKVDHNRVRISKARSQGICWRSLASKGAVIEFENSTGSPFELEASRIEVPAGGFGYSTKLRNDAEERTYKYTVIGGDGSNDPDVVVET